MIKFNLNDRVAIITGGAQGFGFAIAERFISSGAKVIIWDIDENECKKAISKIKNFPISLSKMIEHIILNCDFDDKLESKMRPSFPEALLVKQIVLLDSKMNLMDSVLSEDQEVSRFTSRHNFFGVPILKKNDSE